MTPSEPFQFIDNTAALADWCSAVSGDTCAVDTEFERQRTYYATLCLIQIAADERIAIVDPLAVESLSPLQGLLAGTTRLSCLHAARQDLEVLDGAGLNGFGRLHDTQIAAALVGFNEQIGYAALVEQLLDVSLPKSQTRTDWSRRPLSAKQLDYAADDVRYLGAVHVALIERLSQLGRLSWFEQECRALADNQQFFPEPDTAWQRVKGIHALDDAAFMRAAALAAWREALAQEKDLPRSWIVKDNDIIALSQLQSPSSAHIANILSSSAGASKRHNQPLADLLNGPIDEIERPAHQIPTPQQRRTAKALAKQVRDLGESMQIPASVLLTRREIDQLAAGESVARLEAGWRSEVVKPALTL